MLGWGGGGCTRAAPTPPPWLTRGLSPLSQAGVGLGTVGLGQRGPPLVSLHAGVTLRPCYGDESPQGWGQPRGWDPRGGTAMSRAPAAARQGDGPVRSWGARPLQPGRWHPTGSWPSRVPSIHLAGDVAASGWEHLGAFGDPPFCRPSPFQDPHGGFGGPFPVWWGRRPPTRSTSPPGTFVPQFLPGGPGWVIAP